MPSGINVGKIEAELSASPDRMVKGIATARSALDSIRAELKRLDEEFKRGAITTAAHTQRFGDLQAATVRLQNAMQGAFTTLQATGSGLDTIASKAAQTRTAFGGIGATMMQVGYAIDDVRYGLGAVVNNASQLTGSLAGALGATAGQASAAAGGVQILAVGIYELYQHSDKLYALMGLPVFKTASEEMEELGKKTAKTAEETKKLADYEATRASAKKRTESDSTSEKSEKEIDKTIAEAGGESVRMGFEKALLEEGGDKISPKREEEIRKATRGLFGPLMATMTGGDMHAEEEKALAKEREDVLQKQLNDLMGGKSAVDKQKRLELIKKHPELFKEGLASDLEAAEPEALKTREEEHQQHLWEREGRKNEAAYVKKKEAREKREGTEEDARARDWRKQNVEAAKGVLPGFDEKSKDIAAKYAGSGRSKAEAIANMTSELKIGKDGKFMTEEDAYAAAKDTVGKEFDEFKADPRKLKAHEKSRRRELTERAKEAVPGLDDLAKTATKAGMGSGDVKSMVAEALRSQGFSPEEAATVAGDTQAGAEKGLGREAQRSGLAKHSEVYNLAGMTERIQAGVGGENDQGKAQVDLLKQIADLNKQLLEKSDGVRIKVT